MSIFRDVYGLLSQDKTLALVTVVATWGSTPQVAGAMMVVNSDGSTAGTVGGGNAERLITQDAILTLRENRPMLKDYLLTEGGNTEMVCGGKMRVFIEPVGEEKDFFEDLDNEAGSGRTSALAIIISGKEILSSFIGKKMLITSDGIAMGSLGMEKIEKLVVPESSKAIKEGSPRLRTYILEETKKQEVIIFINVIPGEANLIIAGGGHIAKPLLEIAKVLGFNVTIVDDRKEYANKFRFPLADEIICGDFKDVFSNLALNKNSNVVVVTYGHRYDEQVLEEVLKSKAGYIGCIGSKRKAKQTLQYLKGAGYSEENVKRVHIPVGLDIGAKTPAEISLSILAEIVKERRK